MTTPELRAALDLAADHLEDLFLPEDRVQITTVCAVLRDHPALLYVQSHINTDQSRTQPMRAPRHSATL